MNNENRLSRIGDVFRKNGRGYALFLCKCGKEKEIRVDQVNNSTKSCGCLFIETRRLANLSHGMARTKIYRIWIGMRQRCENIKSKHFRLYGARGINVCDRWKDFSLFFIDMGNPPAGKSLDRIDNNGSYSPDNCRWATHSEQCNNTRQNVWLKYKGEKLTVSQWAKKLGMKRSTLNGRIEKKFALNKILSKGTFDVWTGRKHTNITKERMKLAWIKRRGKYGLF